MEGSSVRKQQTRVFSVTGIKPFELYCLRHTCLTRWAPKMDPFTLAYLAGHSDISITKRYVHPEDETIKAAMERAASEQLSPPSTPPRVFEGEMTAVTTVAAIIEARELWKSGREDLNLRPPGPESDFGTY